MRVLTRNISAFMIAIFAIFFCGNTAFIHSHIIQGHRITHSHPYAPGPEHTHSAEAIQFIAQANMTAASMDAAAPILVENLEPRFLRIVEIQVQAQARVTDSRDNLLRGPPIV